MLVNLGSNWCNSRGSWGRGANEGERGGVGICSALIAGGRASQAHEDRGTPGTPGLPCNTPEMRAEVSQLCL